MPPLDRLPADVVASWTQFTRAGSALWDWVVGDVACEWSGPTPTCETQPDPSTLLCDLYESSSPMPSGQSGSSAVPAFLSNAAAAVQRKQPEAAVGILCQAKRFAATSNERSDIYTALSEVSGLLPWLFESGFVVSVERALLTHAVAFDPHNAHARLLRAALLVSTTPETALADLALVETDRARWRGGVVDYHRLRAKVALVAGDAVLAVAEAEQMLPAARGAEAIEARFLRAESLLGAGRTDEALADYLDTCAAVARLRVSPAARREWWNQGVNGALQAARALESDAGLRRVYVSPWVAELPLEDVSEGMRFLYWNADDVGTIRLARTVLEQVNAQWAAVVALPDAERAAPLAALWRHKKDALFIGSWALARLGHDPEPRLGKRPPPGRVTTDRLLSDPIQNLIGMYSDPFPVADAGEEVGPDITAHPLAFVASIAISLQAATRADAKPWNASQRAFLLLGMRPEVTAHWVQLSNMADPDAIWSAEQVVALLAQSVRFAAQTADAEFGAGVLLQLQRYGEAYAAATGTNISEMVNAAILQASEHFVPWVSALQRLGEGHATNYRRQPYSQFAVEFARMAEAYSPADVALKAAKVEALVQLHRFSPTTDDPAFQTERVLREALEALQAVIAVREAGGPVNDPSIAPVDLVEDDARAEEFRQIAAVWEKKVRDVVAELALYRDVPADVPLSSLRLFDELRTTCDAGDAAASPVAEQCTALSRHAEHVPHKELWYLGWVASEYMEYLTDSRVPKGVPSNTPEERALRFELTAATLVAGVALRRMVEWYADDPEGWLELSRWFYNLGKKEESFERSIDVARRVITVVDLLRKKQLAGAEQFGDAVRNTSWTFIEAARKMGRSSIASATALLAQVEPLLAQADQVVLLPIYRRDLVYLWIKYYIVRQNLSEQRRIWAAAERFGEAPKLCVRVSEIAPQDAQAMRYYDLVQRRVKELEQLEQRSGPLLFAKAGIAHHWGRFSEAADWYEKALSADGWPTDARQERINTKDELADALKNYLCTDRPAYPESCRVAGRIVELTNDLTQAYANSQEYAEVLRRATAVQALYCQTGTAATPSGAP